MANPTHFKIPLRIGADGRFETWEQDTDDDVLQCVAVVASTPIGSRIELPQFGIPRITFAEEVPMASVLAAIYTWEPRASLVLRRELHEDDDLASTISVTEVGQ